MIKVCTELRKSALPSNSTPMVDGRYKTDINLLDDSAFGLADA